MVEYSRFDKSAVCASSGFAVGRKGSEVRFMTGRALGDTATAAGNYVFSTGEVSCSGSATIDTGLTTVSYATWNVKGKNAAGNVNTLDSIATPDASLGKSGHAAFAQGRYSGGNIWFKSYDASADRATKAAIISYVAIGT